jgi:hypothetical protein
MRDAAGAAGTAVGVAAGDVDGLAVDADLARALRTAAEKLQKLGLPVAGDAGDAEDLSRPDREVDALQPLDPCRRRREGSRPRAPSGPASRLLVDARSTLRPTISSASCSGLVSAVRTVAVISPRRMTLTVVRHLHDLAQLVGDQDDRLALRLQSLEDAEQVVGLGRGQHARRLVEDQDVGLAVERLQDLHPLLVADADLLDQRIGIDVQLVVVATAA